MISKEDIKDYLDKMLKLELDMESEYKMLASKVKTPEYKKAFLQLEKDENMHATFVKELQSLLKNWK